jgi:hypothetical protein
MLLRVSPGYVAAALAIADDERHAVMNGYRPLIRPKAKPETLAARLARATAAERAEAARVVGASAIWDEMLMPLL